MSYFDLFKLRFQFHFPWLYDLIFPITPTKVFIFFGIWGFIGIVVHWVDEANKKDEEKKKKEEEARLKYQSK